MAVALGKRYKDEDSGVEVLCIKPGECDLNVDGRPMEELQPKVLPSADQLIRPKTQYNYPSTWLVVNVRFIKSSRIKNERDQIERDPSRTK